MDDEDYCRFTDCIFYEIFEDGTIDAFMFHRDRMVDSVFCYSGPIPAFLYQKGQHTLDEVFYFDASQKSIIRKKETEDIIERFLPGSVHFPFGCLDEPLPVGRYWMYTDERNITDPVPPLVDRVGIVDWTIHRAEGDPEEHFRGDLRQAMDRFWEIKSNEYSIMIDQILFRGQSTDDVDSGNRCYLTSERFSGLKFMMDGACLQAYEQSKLILSFILDELDHFIQKN